jgi:hypothetical protein
MGICVYTILYSTIIIVEWLSKYRCDVVGSTVLYSGVLPISWAVWTRSVCRSIESDCIVLYRSRTIVVLPMILAVRPKSLGVLPMSLRVFTMTAGVLYCTVLYCTSNDIYCTVLYCTSICGVEPHIGHLPHDASDSGTRRVCVCVCVHVRVCVCMCISAL